ncbi:MAG: peptidoglycan DD-metalloendopeptidase family protein [Armatimonadetes bacterium]|nr:peptidoglycan DD-metalloendopeptidase family protein [Anaerolineae bacterium]
MLNPPGFEEPPIHPDDTQPTRNLPLIDLNARRPKTAQRLLGVVLLFSTVGLFAATAAVALTPVQQVVMRVTATPTQPSSAEVASGVLPTLQPTQQIAVAAGILPTLSDPARQALLATPVTALTVANAVQIKRVGYQPFTIIPDRPRNRVEEYTIQKGDSINAIAERFGVTPETIAWSNDRREVWVLSPGASLYILPVNGVYHQAVGDATVAEIAALYGVTDVQSVLKSEYNALLGLSAESVPPSGMRIVVPEGVAEAINWSPTVVTVGGGAGGGDGMVAFDPSSPGSCAAQSPGVAGGWQAPLGFYTFMRGFSSYHTGIDLAASNGTPVQAANSGTVIFAGWSNYGYGIAVVISHGAFSTLYGHLSSENVGCGQIVGGGQTIGAVGTTGNSSGPHLHFEIQYSGIPTNPTEIMPF